MTAKTFHEHCGLATVDELREAHQKEKEEKLVTEVKLPRLRYPINTKNMAEHVRLAYLNYDIIYKLIYDFDYANENTKMYILYDALANLENLGRFIEHTLDGGSMFDPPLDGNTDVIFGEE